MMSERYSYEEIAKRIDHSLLNPALTAQEVEAGCKIARQYRVASVCILPYYLARSAELLSGCDVQPSATRSVLECDKTNEGTNVT
jgi:deoxyribose-phosphate aldolase